ncbi:hypothetical protein D9M70_634620 [compost metagenome]
MDEHAAGAAGGVEDAAMKRLDHLDDQLHNAGRREILATLLHEGGGEFAHEIFEDQAVGIACNRERLQQPQ